MKKGKALTEIILRKLPDYGDHMTMEHFNANCDCGGFIDYDGYGNLATETNCSDIEIYPSIRKTMNIPKWATHVVWYNK